MLEERIFERISTRLVLRESELEWGGTRGRPQNPHPMPTEES